MSEIARERIDDTYERLLEETEAAGYRLNPDVEFTKDLILGLLANEDRYGYRACPCRLADGVREDDLDIICPCDYRDLDLEEFGTCYCALYVSEEVYQGKKQVGPIPDRRPPREQRDRAGSEQPAGLTSGSKRLKYPVWCCRVCGYLCARDKPPGKCPVCKADKDRFERFV